MKIAVFQNFLDTIGGAEIVGLTLARELNADIYTTNIDPQKIKSLGFDDVLPRIHSIGTIPKQAPVRHQLMSRLFRKLNLGKKYDFYIISGDWAMSAAVNNKPNIWYAHGPLNELWSYRAYVRQELVKPWKRPLFDTWVFFNQKLTLKYAKHVTVWACNSKNSQARIRQYYRKDAEVTYPPTNTASYSNAVSNTVGNSPKKEYWLSVNRLLNHKRVEIQMEAFKKLPAEKLIIVGSYEEGAAQFETYKKKMEDLRPPNVTLFHWVPAEKLLQLYSECKGFITTAKDEDFGMTAIEAMASGKPVIAPNEGGYRESVIDGKTGILINDIDAAKLAEAVKKINATLRQNPNHYAAACRTQAEKFDTSVFISKIKVLMSKD